MDPIKINNPLAGMPVALVDPVIVRDMERHDPVRKAAGIFGAILNRIRIQQPAQGRKFPLKRPKTHIRPQWCKMVGIKAQPQAWHTLQQEFNFL